MRTKVLRQASLVVFITAALSGCAGIVAKPTDRAPDFVQLFQETRDSVVWIKAKIAQLNVDENDKNKELEKEVKPVSGSGVVVSSRQLPSGQFELHILTNDHVVHDAVEVWIYFPKNERYKGEIVGYSQLHDLSLVRVVALKRFKLAILGDSDLLKIGEWVYTIGNPFGNSWSLSVGTIGNLKQDPVLDHIQFDGGVNPGNSGGGLFNQKGELIGIVYGKPIGGSIGFAISVNRVKKLLPLLTKGGRVPRPFIGAELGDIESVTPQIAKKENLPWPLPREQGVIIIDLFTGLPAERAGIKEGDIVLKIDGQPADDTRHMQSIIAESEIGKPIFIKVLRGEMMLIIPAITERSSNLF